MSDSQAYSWIDISVRFDEETVRQFGMKKLVLLLRAPVVEQPAIMKKIKAGASAREVQAALRVAKIQHDMMRTSRDTGRKQTPTGQQRSTNEISLMLRVTLAEKQILAAAAKMAGMDLSAWLRQLALDAARRKVRS
jgi:hypothetical protein